MSATSIYFPVNTIGSEYKCTRKDRTNSFTRSL